MRDRTYVITALIPAAVFAAAAVLAESRGFLPSLPVVLSLFIVSRSGWFGIVLASIACGFVFAVANLYLRFLRKRPGPDSSRWIWIPSLAALAISFVLSLAFYSTGVRYALDYEGLTYYKVYAIGALWTFGIAALWLRRIIKAFPRRSPAANAQSALRFNAFLAILFLTTMFPYFGELP